MACQVLFLVLVVALLLAYMVRFLPRGDRARVFRTIRHFACGEVTVTAYISCIVLVLPSRDRVSLECK